MPASARILRVILKSVSVVACRQSLQFSPTNKVKKISIVKYKRKIKANPQSRYNICTRNVPITTLALSFDEVLPKRILIPANNLTKKVNLTLKNKTFRQIVLASGLTLKS